MPQKFRLREKIVTLEQKQQLKKQLWGIANELRGKMDADEFRDYILEFVFYKYLSGIQHQYANILLQTEAVKERGKGVGINLSL